MLVDADVGGILSTQTTGLQNLFVFVHLAPDLVVIAEHLENVPLYSLQLYSFSIHPP